MRFHAWGLQSDPFLGTQQAQLGTGEDLLNLGSPKCRAIRFKRVDAVIRLLQSRTAIRTDRQGHRTLFRGAAGRCQDCLKKLSSEITNVFFSHRNRISATARSRKNCVSLPNWRRKACISADSVGAAGLHGQKIGFPKNRSKVLEELLV